MWKKVSKSKLYQYMFIIIITGYIGFTGFFYSLYLIFYELLVEPLLPKHWYGQGDAKQFVVSVILIGNFILMLYIKRYFATKYTRINSKNMGKAKKAEVKDLNLVAVFVAIVTTIVYIVVFDQYYIWYSYR